MASVPTVLALSNHRGRIWIKAGATDGKLHLTMRKDKLSMLPRDSVLRFLNRGVPALCLVVLLSQAAFGDQPDEHLEKAKRFVSQMAAGEFNTAVGPFDETMKRALPATKLNEIWSGLVKQYGPLRQATDTRTETVQQYTIIFVTCEFERGKLDAKVVFNTNGEIGGLFFVPSGQYQRPSYVDPAKFTEQDVTIGEGMMRLAGTLSLPLGNGPFPAVILVLHGERDYQVTMEDFARWKNALAERDDVKLISYPQLNHLFIEGQGKSTPQEYFSPGNVAVAVLEDVAKWIENQNK